MLLNLLGVKKLPKIDIVLAIPIEISSYLFLHEAKLIAKVIGILNVLCKLTNEEGKKVPKIQID